MILTTTFDVPGKDYEIIALVNGNTVQSKNALKDIGAGLKSIVGGELGSYKKMISEARETVTERMVQMAEELGADAIVGIRYGSSSIMEGASELFAYGTAVKFK